MSRRKTSIITSAKLRREIKEDLIRTFGNRVAVIVFRSAIMQSMDDGEDVAYMGLYPSSIPNERLVAEYFAEKGGEKLVSEQHGLYLFVPWGTGRVYDGDGNELSKNQAAVVRFRS